MELYDGIFEPHFQIQSLQRRQNFIPSGRFGKSKECISRNFQFSPRVKRYLKAVQLINLETDIKKLEQTYTLHKNEHPGCSILPKIRNEIVKRKDSPTELNFIRFKHAGALSLQSKTPDPRVSFKNSLNISKLVLKNPKF